MGGEKIEIARIILFCIGALSVTGMFFLARLHFENNSIALASAFLFQFSPVFFYYTINPLPDMLALMASIWYLYFILLNRKTNKSKHLILASIFLLFACLAKLPFLMFSIVSIYIFAKDKLIKNPLESNTWQYPFIQFSIILPALTWYAWVMPSWTGNPVLTGIFSSGFPFSELMDIINYHLNTMFPDILLYKPVWIPFLIGIPGLIYFREKKGWFLILVFITFVYLITQLNAINTVHDYYMLPFLPWLFILTGYGVKVLIKIPFYIGSVILLFICAWAPAFTSKATSDLWSLEKTYFNPDVFLYSDKLQSVVPDDELCIILNDESKYIFSYQIDKMGHIFDHDNLPPGWIGDMIVNYDVNYMYSDSRIVDQNTEIKKYLDTLLLEAGNVHVYKLKMPDENK